MSSMISIPDIEGMERSASVSSIPDGAGIGDPATMTSNPDIEGIGSSASMSSISNTTEIGDPVPITSIPDTTEIESPVLMPSIPDIGGAGKAAPTNSIPDFEGIGSPVPITSIPDGTGILNPVPMISTPDVIWLGDTAFIETNDNNNTSSATSPAKRETNRFEGLCLAQRLRLIEQERVQFEAPHDSSMSVASFSLTPLPSGYFTFSLDTTVPPIVPHPLNTTVPTTVNTTVSTEVLTTVPTVVPNPANTEVSITVDTTVSPTVDESDLPPADDEQTSFPYTLYDFTKSGIVVSEIRGVTVREQYHKIKEIVGEACGKCPKCTSDTRVQDLIDRIIDIRFPDLDSALFRDGILSEFGFDDYWNELIVAKPEVRRGYVKFENWNAKVWQDIEANDDLPAISKAIEKEFGQSRDFRRVLAGQQHPKCKWRKMALLLFVIRIRRIRGKLEDRSQKQEKRETQTIETTAKKNRKTRDQEKRRKLRDREDKVAAKLLYDTFKEFNMLKMEADSRKCMTVRTGSSKFSLKVKASPLEGIYSGWEKPEVFLPFIKIQEFVSSMKVS